METENMSLTPEEQEFILKRRERALKKERKKELALGAASIEELYSKTKSMRYFYGESMLTPEQCIDEANKIIEYAKKYLTQKAIKTNCKRITNKMLADQWSLLLSFNESYCQFCLRDNTVVIEGGCFDLEHDQRPRYLIDDIGFIVLDWRDAYPIFVSKINVTGLKFGKRINVDDKDIRVDVFVVSNLFDYSIDGYELEEKFAKDWSWYDLTARYKNFYCRSYSNKILSEKEIVKLLFAKLVNDGKKALKALSKEKENINNFLKSIKCLN